MYQFNSSFHHFYVRGASTPTKAAMKQPSRQGKAGLSAGMSKIISETRGELPPSQLRKFMNQVRGRKKAVEIAGHFTSNIPGLVRQLQEVEANYYRKGTRGVRMDNDIAFVKRLIMRLQRDSANDISNDDYADDFSEDYSSEFYSEDYSSEYCSDDEYNASEEYHNEDIFQSSFSGDGRMESVFASTSSYKHTPPKAAKKKPSMRGMGSLSSGTVNIIYNAGGLLPPLKLCDFLNEVRGRWNAEKIARQFTSDIPGVVNQLQRIKENYHKHGRKGVRMDKDIDFIRRLIVRLQSHRNEEYVTEGYSRETIIRERVETFRRFL